ncbi:MAG: mannonate dehydratase, partial [Devosia sp.]|nr:mannonate dehydratase [Devosia sp.]
MYVGTQMGGAQLAQAGDRYLKQLAQLGVKHVCIDPEGDPWQWNRDVLLRHRDRIEGFGLKLD